MSDNIVVIGPEKLAAMVNGVIRCLAGQGIFAKDLDVVLDGTDNEATPTYQTDDGRAVPHVTREKRPDVRANRHAKKVKVQVFGWKVWVVWDPASKIPLALAIDGINEPDNKHVLAVLKIASENIAGYARIRSVALDRGFLDGKQYPSREKLNRWRIPVFAYGFSSGMRRSRTYDARRFWARLQLPAFVISALGSGPSAAIGRGGSPDPPTCVDEAAIRHLQDGRLPG